MNRLVSAAMVLTLSAIVAEIVKNTSPRWIGWTSIAIAGSDEVVGMEQNRVDELLVTGVR